MFQRLFRTFSRDLAVDLGTSNTLVYLKDRGVVVNEATVVAINTKTGQILEVGRSALRMLGKTPPYLQIVQPLVNGVISDFEVTEKMLKYFVDRVHREQPMLAPRPAVVIGIPLEVTEVEKKAVEDAVTSAGAREVFMVENVVAAAVGARLPIQDPSGNMIVDVGGGLTQIAVISLSGVVAHKVLRTAGSTLDADLVQYARNEYNLLVGEKMVEELKVRLSQSTDALAATELKVRGRDLITGLPREIALTGTEIMAALERSVSAIIDGVKSALEITPPELVADIHQQGITLVGGGSQLRDLAARLSDAIKIPVRVIEDPATGAVRGMGLLLEDRRLLREVVVPSTQEQAVLR